MHSHSFHPYSYHHWIHPLLLHSVTPLATAAINTTNTAIYLILILNQYHPFVIWSPVMVQNTVVLVDSLRVQVLHHFVVFLSQLWLSSHFHSLHFALRAAFGLLVTSASMRFVSSVTSLLLIAWLLQILRFTLLDLSQLRVYANDPWWCYQIM